MLGGNIFTPAPSCTAHCGPFVNSAGDSVLAEFASVVNAVQCAVDIQTTLKAENANIPPERRIEFRIVVNSLCEYDEERSYQGRWCCNRTPLKTFVDYLLLAREKILATAALEQGGAEG